MSLTAGTRLGPYEVVGPLGGGGMGEVYRARDTRLDRTVAIKVLPPQLSDDPALKQRFEREARAISSLQHPHICTLHDIGQQDGIDYLVMEYLEGQTLADRLSKGPLPLDQALRYAAQVADALDKAHRAGIVHRDLKPANIMITKSGAKLLDFGLAKLRGSDSDGVFSAQSDLPTERISLTGEGTIVGTFQYMAPEQLEAGQVDARTDIFAFGAVFYEMLTGKKPFTGKSQASLIGAILKDEPPAISTIEPTSPVALDHVVKTCLAKDPDERWQTARDLMLELKWVAEAGSHSSAAAPVGVRGKNRERLAWMAATAILLLASLPFVIAYFRRAPTAVRATRFVIPAAEKQALSIPSVSPDGRSVVYSASTEVKTQLWIRPLESLTAQPLPGTEGVIVPAFWSPDSRQIAFFSDRKLKKMDISGGPAQVIADAGDAFVARGGTWNRDGVIVFSPSGSSPLYRVSATGGEATQLTTLDESRQEDSHRWPFFLPDGRHFLYLAPGRGAGQVKDYAIYVGSLDSKEAKLITTADSNAAYAPPGYLLFARGGTLMAQPFDADKLEVTGEAYPVAENIRSNPANLLGSFSISEGGALVYLTGNPAPYQLTWFDRTGKPLGTIGPPAAYRFIRLSPDEKRAAVERTDPPTGGYDIWLIDLARGVPSRLTSSPAEEFFPVWSPDGSRIAFSSGRGDQLDLYQKPSSGAGGEEELLKSPENKAVLDWSPDGRFILYRVLGKKTLSDIWVLPLFGDRQPYPLVDTRFNEGQGGAKFSPDGRWVAYVSDETGRPEVYVREFQGTGGKWPVSTGGGRWPRWRGDGKEIFYTFGAKVMAVEVKAVGSSFEPGVPKVLFERAGAGNYDVSRDGQRFLIPASVEESSPTPITVVLNWAADLKR